MVVMLSHKFLLLDPTSEVFRSALAGASMDYYFKYSKYLNNQEAKGLYAILASTNGFDYMIRKVIPAEEAIKTIATEIAKSAAYKGAIEIEGIDTIEMMQSIYDQRRKILQERNLDEICDLSFICRIGKSSTLITFECD